MSDEHDEHDDAPAWDAPKTRDECERRLADSHQLIQSLNSQLGQKNVTASGRKRLPDAAWADWRNRLRVKAHHAASEHARLKAWKRGCHRDYRQAAVAAGGRAEEGVLAGLFGAATAVKQYLLGVLDELARVQAENTALRARVADLEGRRAHAPPTAAGVDGWRDGFTPADQASLVPAAGGCPVCRDPRCENPGGKH